MPDETSPTVFRSLSSIKEETESMKTGSTVYKPSERMKAVPKIEPVADIPEETQEQKEEAPIEASTDS